MSYKSKLSTNRITSVVSKLKNRLVKHDLKTLYGIYLGFLGADAAMTADGWSKGRGGEKDPVALDMMVKHGPYVGITTVSCLDALLTFLKAATGYYVMKAIPELEKYPRVKKIWPYILLLYRTSDHVNGARSWLK
jgi:hypothetical protein